jgi:hypothetical protein
MPFSIGVSLFLMGCVNFDIQYKRNYSSVIARSEEDSFALLGTG